MLKGILDWFSTNPIPSPPEIISWASICIAILLGIIKAWETWQSRPKLDLEVLASNRYCHYWHLSEAELAADKAGRTTNRYSFSGDILAVSENDCKSCFEVLEFAIRNNYRRDITLGRFHIAGWIFSDKHTPQMYGKKRDYRVFDLFTREPINLEAYRVIPPGGMFGIRLESWEEANGGPGYTSNHLYYKVDLHKRYSILFNTDIGRMTRRAKLSTPEKNPVDYPYIYRWSEDLIGAMDKSMGTDFPQSVQSPYEFEFNPPWHKHLIRRIRGRMQGLTRRIRNTFSGAGKILP